MGRQYYLWLAAYDLAPPLLHSYKYGTARCLLPRDAFMIARSLLNAVASFVLSLQEYSRPLGNGPEETF